MSWWYREEKMVRILEHSTREDRATEQKRRELEREGRETRGKREGGRSRKEEEGRRKGREISAEIQKVSSGL